MEFFRVEHEHRDVESSGVGEGRVQKAARNPEASEAGRRHGLVERRVFVFCDRERAAERELHLGVDEAPEGWQLAEAAHERHPRRGAAEAEHGCCGVRIERGDAADELHLGRPSFQVRGEQRLGLDGSANGDSEKRDVCVALACEAAERGWDLRVVVVVAVVIVAALSSLVFFGLRFNGRSEKRPRRTTAPLYSG